MGLDDLIFYCIISDKYNKEILITLNDDEVTNHLLDNLYLCFSEWEKITLYYADTGNFHSEINNTSLTNDNRFLNYRRRKRYRNIYLKRNNYLRTNFFDTNIFQNLSTKEKLNFNELQKKENSNEIIKNWKSKKNEKPKYENFYVLTFINETFIKIGITTNFIEHRIFQYLFDHNVNFPKNCERIDRPLIDIHNSIIFETKNAFFIEKLIKKNFIKHKKGSLNEWYDVSIKREILDFLENYNNLYNGKQLLCNKIGFADIFEFIYAQPTWNITKWVNTFNYKVIKGNVNCNCLADKNKELLDRFFNECWNDYMYNMENFGESEWDYDYIELIIKIKNEINNIDLFNSKVCEDFLQSNKFILRSPTRFVSS